MRPSPCSPASSCASFVPGGPALRVQQPDDLERGTRALSVHLVRVPRLDHRVAAAQPPRDDLRRRAAARRARRRRRQSSSSSRHALLRVDPRQPRLAGSSPTTGTSRTSRVPFTLGVVYLIVPVAALAIAAYALAAARATRSAALRAPQRREAAPRDHADAGDPGGLVRRAVPRAADLAGDGARRHAPSCSSPASPTSRSPQRIAKSADSFPLLAAPLFILMGNIMNSAGITDAHLRLRDGVRRLDARRAVPRQHPGQRVLRRACRARRSPMRAALGTLEIKAMTRRGLLARHRGRDHRGLGHHRADHPAVAADDHLRRLGRGLDRRPVHRRRHPGPADGGRADGDGARDRARASTCRAIRSRACATCGARSGARSGR